MPSGTGRLERAFEKWCCFPVVHAPIGGVLEPGRGGRRHGDGSTGGSTSASSSGGGVPKLAARSAAMRSPRTRGRPGRPLSLLLALLCALRAKVGARRASSPPALLPSRLSWTPAVERLERAFEPGAPAPAWAPTPGRLLLTRGTPAPKCTLQARQNARSRCSVPRGPSCRIVPTLEPLKPGNRVESLHPVLQMSFTLAGARARRGGREWE